MNASLLAIISLFITLGCYVLSKLLHKRTNKLVFAPIVFAPVVITAIVVLARIPLPIYFTYNHWLMAMLGPATIAFALPIYRHRQLIGQYPLTLLCGVICGLTLGAVSSWLVVHIFTLPSDVAHSMAVHSVSTPFALDATAAFGGVADISAILVLLTGIVGMMIGEPLFKWAKIRSSHAKGSALAAASHGAGAAKATQLGQKEGVIASLTMIFTGIGMVVLSPWLALLMAI
ncbi:putative effector of murein hydrolase [Sinobacterium caligoides]|uniref:Putative effector of murein hydrolase n=1 Tax=Sinobacterium caligoides TaxID=933926 RepID=A0A3N2E015_9GAMM|nr:LrgB family protein [Sinobacterium caligoides]ROS05377.1 putative effector of murein hydrolase [Sinobacterium caligoides]